MRLHDLLTAGALASVTMAAVVYTLHTIGALS